MGSVFWLVFNFRAVGFGDGHIQECSFFSPRRVLRAFSRWEGFSLGLLKTVFLYFWRFWLIRTGWQLFALKNIGQLS